MRDRGRTAGRRPVGAPAGRRPHRPGDAAIRLGGLDRRAAACVGDDDDLRLAHERPSVRADQRGRRPQRADRDRIAPARLDRLGQQVDLATPRRAELAVEHLDAVLPDPHVDGLGLGGHVGPQLRAAPLGEQLDAQGRPGGHRRDDRPDDDGDLGPAVGQGRGEPAPDGRLDRPGPRRVRRCAGRAGPATAASGLTTFRPSRDASQPTW